MICANCSFTLPENAVFCGNCGTPTPAATRPSSPPPPPPHVPAPTMSTVPPPSPPAVMAASNAIDPTFTASPDSPRKKRPIGIFIGAAVAVVALVIAAIVLLGSDDEPNAIDDAGSNSSTAIVPTTAGADTSASTDATTETTAATGETSDVATTTTEAATTTTVAPIKMPDVSNLTEAEARAALEAAGITNAVYTPVPQAGDAGRVLSQSPRTGSLDLAVVEVKISQAVVLPTLAQTDAAATKALLEDTYGASVTVIDVFDPATAVGTVISSDPVADGAALMPTAVTLTVSSAGTELFLDEVATVDDSDCSQGGAKVNTYQSAHAVSCRFNSDYSPGTSKTISYDINRSASLLRLTGGLDDSSPSDGRIRIVIYGDGNKIWEREYGLGESSDEAISVAGVLRLQIEMVYISGAGGYTYGALADARLAGDPTQIANVPRPS